MDEFTHEQAGVINLLASRGQGEGSDIRYFESHLSKLLAFKPMKLQMLMPNLHDELPESKMNIERWFILSAT